MTPRQATARDIPRLALAHAAGVYARRPSWMRALVYPYALTAAFTLIGRVGREEVFVLGKGTSVVMTPERPRRAPAWAGLLLLASYSMTVVVGPIVVATAAVLVGGWLQVLGTSAVILYLGALIAAPLMAAPLRRPRRQQVAAMRRIAASGSVVRLHDLVRHPADPRGTGVRLLGATIREPRFAGATIIATAASERLAGRYVEAGMDRLSPESMTVRFQA
jgi:hypothetical protein